MIAPATVEGWAARFGVALSPTAREGLLAYARLLLTWGKVINLTGAGSVDQVVADHFPDAFALASRLTAASSESSEGEGAGGSGRGGGGGGSGGTGRRLVDVGSGGGLPAIPLALLRPDWSFCLFEPTGKKVAFLRTAIRELGLGSRARVEPVRMRLPNALAGSFDAAVSRATFAPEEWLRLAPHLVRLDGQVFYLGSRRLEEWPPQLEMVSQSGYRVDRWVGELRRST